MFIYSLLKVPVLTQTIKVSIRHDRIGRDIGVAPIKEKMMKNWLRCYKYVQRRYLEAIVRRVDNMILSPVKWGRGRPKTTLENIFKNDLMINDKIWLLSAMA